LEEIKMKGLVFVVGGIPNTCFRQESSYSGFTLSCSQKSACWIIRKELNFYRTAFSLAKLIPQKKQEVKFTFIGDKYLTSAENMLKLFHA